MKKLNIFVFCFFVFCFFVFCFFIHTACSKYIDSAHTYYTNSQNIIRNVEWVSFDVTNSKYHNKILIYKSTPVHVIVHSNPNFIALIHDDYRTLIYKDSIIFINDYYEEIACFHSGCDTYDYYGMICGDEIGNNINMLTFFSPVIEQHSCLDIDTSLYYRNKNGNNLVKGYLTIKLCTNNYCYLKQVPTLLSFETYNNTIQSATYKDRRYNRIQTINNLSFINKRSTIDSLFNIKSNNYANYSFQTDKDGYIYSRSLYNIPDLTEDALSKQLINVYDGHIITLDSLKGKTLICVFKNPKQDLPFLVKNITKSRLELDNIIFLNPYTNNINETKVYTDSLCVSNNTYCSKKMNLLLNTDYNYILIEYPHKMISRSNTLNEIKKALFANEIK